MAGSIFDKWNKEIDTKGVMADEKEASAGKRDFEEVPFGTYEVKVEKIELKECGSVAHKGEPMLSIWFKIINGERKGSLIFMNQLIVQGFQMHIANEFLRSLDTDVEVEFDGNYEHYNDTLLDVLEGTSKLEYVLKYTQNSKGFNTYKIEDVFEV